MTDDFYQALQECLTQARAGVPVEQCLAQYPRYAEDLRPLLMAATASRDQLSAGMSPSTKSRIRSRVMGYWDMKHSRKGAWWFPRLLPVRWAGAAAVAVLLVLGGGAGTVAAAQDSLPGSALYSVKQLREEAGLWFATSPEEKVRAYSGYVKERAREVQELDQRGGNSAVSMSLSRLEQHLSEVDQLTEASAKVPVLESSRYSITETLEGTLVSPDQPSNVQEALAEGSYPCLQHTLRILQGTRDRVGMAAERIVRSLTSSTVSRTPSVDTFCPP
jgi:hypothetical protein